MAESSRRPGSARTSDPVTARTAAPDLVIAGAARSGTSFLAAQLSAHPNIDPGSLKEPNFFSRNYERGFGWYDGFFQPRAEDVLRMDASVSYTFPHFPQALDRLMANAPRAFLVYIVRDPIPRSVSHYLYYRHYFAEETAPDFGTAIRTNKLYCGASDYRHWLEALYQRFPREQVLIVPFSAVADGHVDAQVCAQLQLPPPTGDRDHRAEAHRNNVVTFKHEAFRVVQRRLKHSRFYPAIRERLGADRLRWLRSLVTRETSLPTVEQALASCSPEQLTELYDLERQSREAVAVCLTEQDHRLGLSWLPYWPTRPSRDEPR